MKVCQATREKRRVAPVGLVLSRTAMPRPGRAATSTQVLPPPLWLDLRQCAVVELIVCG